MRRVGPVVATELPGLVIGDVRARHVRLLPDRVEHHDDDGTTAWTWDELADLRITVPVTRTLLANPDAMLSRIGRILR